MGLLSERCNYHSTMQGILVGNHVHNYILENFTSPWNDVAGWTFVIWEIIITLADDFFVIGMAGVSLFEHWDTYNAAKILGKVMKVAV